MRQQRIRQLRQGLGDEAVQKAAELVRGHVADPAAQAATVDRFLDELDQMAPSEAVIETGATARLRAASRDALAAVVAEFDRVTGDLRRRRTRHLGRGAGLGGQAAAHRARAGQAPGRADRRVGCQGPPGGHPCCPARSVTPHSSILRTAVSQRWSTESNLVDAIEHTARLALLKRAEVARPGRRGGGSAVPVRSSPRRRTAAGCTAQRRHHTRRGSNRVAGQGPRRFGGQRYRGGTAVADRRTAARRACRRGRHRPRRARRVASRRGGRARHRRRGAVRCPARPGSPRC